ncbi:hypothetical protein [Nocardia altamirensis]|uniref:hypothetical protein n=1 Tax=Nocardia altamirensis TaxID=472158 RepID=UPI00084089CA|nr:hypothetical protein [Nocardia altamirensis]
MATGVGLRIAEAESTAAIVTDGGDEPLFIVRESVLYMSDDGDATLGGPPPDANARAITGFVPAVGDPAGISIDDGEAYRAEDLVATALFCLINLAAEHLNGPAEFYATHPGDWPREHVQALRDALDYLGLRSVLLVSEADLPSAELFTAPPSTFAYDAARAALASVLSTPAGTTPPDPTHAENSMVDTIVIPAVPASDLTPQAYSAAMPLAEPPMPTAVVEVAAPAPKPVPTKDRKQFPLLIGAAALIGLVLGGFAVALFFRDNSETPVPPVRDAKSDQVSVSPTPPAPPVNLPAVPPTVHAPVTITTTVPLTTQPPPPPPPPPTTEPTPTPPTSTSTTTKPPGPTTTRRGFPFGNSEDDE